jgi:hypothetical protein
VALTNGTTGATASLEGDPIAVIRRGSTSLVLVTRILDSAGASARRTPEAARRRLHAERRTVLNQSISASKLLAAQSTITSRTPRRATWSWCRAWYVCARTPA